MFTVEFQADPVFRKLDAARAVLTDMTPVYQDIGEHMVEATRDRFRTGTAPDGTKWRAKSPATLAAYLARGDGNRPDPLIGASRRLSREIQQLTTRDSVEIGSSLEYSAAMQHGVAKGAFGKTSRGAPIPWGNVPARVWLGISETDERNILDIVDEHLAAPFED